MKEIINTDLAPAPIGPYNQAVKAGKTLYVSGQIPLNAQSGEIVSGDIAKETEMVMENIGHVLKAAGYDYSDVVKTSIFLSDMDLFAEVNAKYGTYFITDAPARETVAVRTLPKNVRVEISVIAYKD